MEHPDLHWFFPLPRPKRASSPEKLARALEEARIDALAFFRQNPLKALPATDTQSTPGSGEPRVLYLAAAKTLRQQAQKRPSQGTRQVFIIADAEALAPQDSSSEAANALLKLLEEPPSGTTLILTSSEPRRLLPTIRSRTNQLHLPPLSLGQVTKFLEEVARVEPEPAAWAAGLAGGSIGRALAFLPDGEDPGPLDAVRTEAFRLFSAAVGGSPMGGFQEASTFRPVGARGMLPLLDSLQDWLRDLALASAGLWEGIGNREKEPFLRDLLGRVAIHPTSVARASRSIDEARLLAAGNVNPQLIVFGLLHQLRDTLLGGGEGRDRGDEDGRSPGRSDAF
jgi:DNA polymerase-3 subunit delta'